METFDQVRGARNTGTLTAVDQKGAEHLTKFTAATCSKFGGIFNDVFMTSLLLESYGEKMLKIGHYLTK